MLYPVSFPAWPLVPPLVLAGSEALQDLSPLSMGTRTSQLLACCKWLGKLRHGDLLLPSCRWGESWGEARSAFALIPSVQALHQY